MPDGDAVSPGNGGQAGRPVRSLHFSRKWAMAIAAFVVVVLLVLPVFSTLQPGYYERYPSLRVRMANWRLSTHSKIACADCHVDPGPLGFIDFAAKSIPAFYSQLLFGPKPTNLLSVPDIAACERCHTTYRQVSAAGDLLIPHRAHVDVLQIKCAVCHKNLVHSLNAAGFNKPEMATCMKCHDGKQAVNQCSKCHTQKAIPENHKAPDWLAIHSTKVHTIDCARCHGFTPDFCGACHKQRPPSHVGNWKTAHAAAVAVRGVKDCYVCHDQKTFCGKCH
jgi:hypothetical protein